MTNALARFGEPWTQREIRQVVQLRNKGYGAAYIAEHLGRSVEGVKQRMLYPRQTRRWHERLICPPRPPHITTSHNDFNTRDWYEQNNTAFVAAMLKHHPERETRLNQGGGHTYECTRYRTPGVDSERVFGPSSMADMA